MKIKKYRIIVLSIVLYGCGTSSVTLREEHRLPARLDGGHPNSNLIPGHATQTNIFAHFEAFNSAHSYT